VIDYDAVFLVFFFVLQIPARKLLLMLCLPVIPLLAGSRVPERPYVPGLALMAKPVRAPESTDKEGPDRILDKLMRPVPGRCTSNFGQRKNPLSRRGTIRKHNGIDLRAVHGQPVIAAMDGRVVRARRSKGYGKAIYINHGDGVQTRYAHLSEIGVDHGQRVKAGEIIGRVGKTGRATGPHLHFEVRIGGAAIDPMSIDAAFTKATEGARAGRPTVIPFFSRSHSAP
jgi:murein DD-endopeptidase MepM/ murein hydrolase activator NlpD